MQHEEAAARTTTSSAGRIAFYAAAALTLLLGYRAYNAPEAARTAAGAAFAASAGVTMWALGLRGILEGKVRRRIVRTEAPLTFWVTIALYFGVGCGLVAGGLLTLR